MTVSKPPSASQMLSKVLGGQESSRGTNFGVAAAVVLAVTLLLLAVIAWPLLSLRFGTRTSESTSAPGGGGGAPEEFQTALDANLRQVTGRSMFFPPLPMSPKEELVSTPKATRYAGPAIVAMVNGAVWFSDGQRLEVGQSSPSGKMKVISLKAPWSARILWDGGEFDVGFFERSPLLTGRVDPATARTDWSSYTGFSSTPSRPAASSAASRPRRGDEGPSFDRPPPGREPQILIDIPQADSPAAPEPPQPAPPPTNPVPPDRTDPGREPSTSPSSGPDPTPPATNSDPHEPAPEPSPAPQTEPEKQTK